jgi:cytochrome b561
MQQRPHSAAGTFSQRHPNAVVLLHWLGAAAITAAVLLVLARDQVGARELKRLLLDHHRSLGLLVLGLVGARLAARLIHRRALVRHPLPRLLGLASGVAQWGLYLLMAATPILGWALTSANDQDASLFGLLTLPPLVEPDTDLADTLAEWHAVAAWSLVGLAAAHAAAALWHRYVRRDGVLQAMLPALSRESRASGARVPAQSA